MREAAESGETYALAILLWCDQSRRYHHGTSAI